MTAYLKTIKDKINKALANNKIPTDILVSAKIYKELLESREYNRQLYLNNEARLFYSNTKYTVPIECNEFCDDIYLSVTENHIPVQSSGLFMNMAHRQCKACGTGIILHYSEVSNPKLYYCKDCPKPRDYSEKTAVAIQQAISNMNNKKEEDEDDAAWGELFSDYDLIDNDWPDAYLNEKTCECGATAAGLKFHSRWCPMYEDPMG